MLDQGRAYKNLRNKKHWQMRIRKLGKTTQSRKSWKHTKYVTTHPEQREIRDLKKKIKRIEEEKEI